MEEIFSALNTENTFDYNQSPIPGNLLKSKFLQTDYNDIEIKYLVANLSDEQERETVERIMTRSLRSLNMFKEVGDIIVFREDQSWDKDGNYSVAIKYAVKINTPPKQDDGE